jgi:leader peptidase (prepilin peptidase)/N-methyltransferase
MSVAAVMPLVLAPAALVAATLALRREFPEEGLWRPLAVQLAVALSMIVIAALAELDAMQSARLAAVAAAAAAIVIVDVRRLLVPDVLVLTLVVVALAAPGALSPWQQLTGAAALGGLLLAVRWLHRWRRGAEGLGIGDVKLAAAVGLLLGPLAALQATAAAAVVAIAWILCRRAPTTTPAPFGAALAVGLCVAVALSPAGHA